MSDSTSDVQLDKQPAEQPTTAKKEPATAKPTPVTSAATAPPSFSERLQATLAQPGEHVRLGPWIVVPIALVIIAILLLPPISLTRRLGITGYTTLNATNSSLSHPDGLTLSVNPETFTDRLRVRLESVPRLEFLEGSAGADLRKAVEALPEHLAVEGPVYQIQTRGGFSQPVMVDVVMPNDAEPWETLDLYTWTGKEWKWVGSELHTEVAEHEFIRAQVTDMPDMLVVVQSGLIPPSVSTSFDPDDNPMSTAAGVLTEINPSGLLLGTDGNFVGDPNSLPQPDAAGTYTVRPTLRNWAPGATINRGLLSDLLTIPEIQQSHVANIVQLCTERGFAGVDVDYRGVAPEQRDAYSNFISALAEALHGEGLQMSITVEPPTPTDGGWDTGGYDWSALGASADAFRVPFPEDPIAYAEGGQAHRLLEWATAQVPRYKLRMLVSSLSVERSGEAVTAISLEQALAPFGNVVALSETTHVAPGSQVEFGLSGQLLSITPQESASTYRLEYVTGSGETRTVWLGTAANLATKLQWAQRYRLGGIAVADMLDPGNAGGIVDAVSSYTASAAPPAAQQMEVAWTAASEAATVDQQVSPLTEPGYTWMVLATDGTYTVKASIAGFDHGSVQVTVGKPETVATEPVTETVASEEASAEMVATGAITTTAGAESATGETSNDCLDASYVADVTIPDNTQLDNGEEFEKTWRVRNSGTCAWPEDTVMAFSSGTQMDAPTTVEVGALEPGAQVDVSVKMKAPGDPGKYTGVWGMQTTDGSFGGNLSVVILAGEVAEQPTVAPAPVSAGGFELGGHVRDTGLPFADKMHYAGMNWTKVQVHYGQDASGIIAVAHANGFKVQLSALGTPDMVTQAGFEQGFASWVAGLAAAGADAIEVWNEPNIEREWQIGYINPAAYTKLLCASYSAIKAANPGTAVISAAPSPTGYFGGCSVNGCDDAPWMTGLRDAGAAQCMDYLGAHHNAGATSPSARIGHPANPGDTHHSWFFLPQTELYYNTFGGARKLFYTEMGYASQQGVPTFSDWFAWARGTDNSEQAAWLAEAVQLSVNTGMVRCIIVWNMDFVRYGDDPQDGYAIIRPDGSCPACDSLHNVLGTR
jgi:spore germination protein YaaH